MNALAAGDKLKKFTRVTWTTSTGFRGTGTTTNDQDTDGTTTVAVDGATPSDPQTIVHIKTASLTAI